MISVLMLCGQTQTDAQALHYKRQRYLAMIDVCQQLCVIKQLDSVLCICMCSTTGIAVSLRGLLSDEDNYVRCLTAQALTILAGKEILLMGIHKCILLKINQ